MSPRTPFIYAVLVFVIMGITGVSAQIPLDPSGNPISLSFSPETPGPREDVTARVESLSYDLNRSVISWFIDGVLALKGTGASTLVFTTKDTGRVTDVRVLVEHPERGQARISTTIRPVGLDLIYEAQSYTPPFYRGRALSGFGAPAKVVAVPLFKTSGGAPLKPETLIYSWTKNGTFIQAASGVGRQEFFFDDVSFTRAGETEVIAAVSSPDRLLTAKKRVVVRPFDTKIVLYEDDPLVGVVYEKALGLLTELVRDEMTITASPYFFSVSGKDSFNLDYQWTVNNTRVSPVGSEASRLTVRGEDGRSGESRIGLTIQNLSDIMQSASAALTIAFGK